MAPATPGSPTPTPPPPSTRPVGPEQGADAAGPEPEAARGAAPALAGASAEGPGMAIAEQRLRRVEGNPSLLIGNQFRLEERRLMQGTGGPVRETRPW